MELATSGATLVCWDIDKKGNEKLAKELSTIGQREVKAYYVDVSQKNQVYAAAENVQSKT